jgi:type IV secretory pathway TrbL component
VTSITPTQRIVTVAGIAGSLIAGGVVGTNLMGPLAAAAANNGNSSAAAAASASPSASAGSFKSNEDATHEAGETAEVEAQENAGQRPHGAGSGTFKPNEDPAHEAKESAEREAQEDAGQRPTVP